VEVNILIQICQILGAEFDSNYLNSIKDDCKKIEYLLNQIYKFLGGE